MATLEEKLIVAEEKATVPNKTTISESLDKWMRCVPSAFGKSLLRELALADVLEDKLEGEMMHLQHGSALPHTENCVR